MAVGAAHRLPCAARDRAGAQNSFRSPSVRCIRPAAPSQFTTCAARTGPIAALLSAIAQGPACPWALGRHSDVRRDVLGPASQIAAAGYPLSLCVGSVAWHGVAGSGRAHRGMALPPGAGSIRGRPYGGGESVRSNAAVRWCAPPWPASVSRSTGGAPSPCRHLPQQSSTKQPVTSDSCVPTAGAVNPGLCFKLSNMKPARPPPPPWHASRRVAATCARPGYLLGGRQRCAAAGCR